MTDSCDEALADFSISTELDIERSRLWALVVAPPAINREFWPLLKMTFPGGVTDVTRGWQPGRRQFRSWLLLFGVLPLDYDDVVLIDVQPGVFIHEKSRLFSHSVWEHERILEDTGNGCRLTDRLHFQPVRWLPAVVSAWFVRTIFRHRHRRLRRCYGVN